ncbi:hypothetical protein HDR59_05400, partial [bacterium]|nr:hypothetical protein [bacterium]
MNKLIAVSALTLLPTTTRAESVYMCEPCPAGYSCNNGVKTICPAGTFASVGAKSCTSCAAGTYSNKGASSCSSCPEGYKANSSQTGCDKLKSCYYSFSTASNGSGYSYHGKQSCYRTSSVRTSNGVSFNSTRCYCYVYDQSGSPVYNVLNGCDYDITLAHGDSIHGKRCDDGVLR